MSIFPKHREDANLTVCMGLESSVRDADYNYLQKILQIFKYNSGNEGEYDDIKEAIGKALESVPGRDKVDSLYSIMANPAHHQHGSLPRKVSEAIISELKDRPYTYGGDSSSEWPGVLEVFD
tara:strand:+ start:515 stop:880 length:366 start_codon:yes stop_codon:yes gene_type:complete